MNPQIVKPLSYLAITLVMILSLWYVYQTYQQGETKWNFLVLGFGIAILLGLNLIKGRKRRY